MKGAAEVCSHACSSCQSPRQPWEWANLARSSPRWQRRSHRPRWGRSSARNGGCGGRSREPIEVVIRRREPERGVRVPVSRRGAVRWNTDRQAAEGSCSPRCGRTAPRSGCRDRSDVLTFLEPGQETRRRRSSGQSESRSRTSSFGDRLPVLVRLRPHARQVTEAAYRLGQLEQRGLELLESSSGTCPIVDRRLPGHGRARIRRMLRKSVRSRHARDPAARAQRARPRAGPKTRKHVHVVFPLGGMGRPSMKSEGRDRREVEGANRCKLGPEVDLHTDLTNCTRPSSAVAVRVGRGSPRHARERVRRSGHVAARRGTR